MHHPDLSPSAVCGESPSSCEGTAETFNHACFCISLDRDALAAALEAQLGDAALANMVRERCPHAFAERPVFVAASRLHRMAEVVRAVERVVAIPGWREHIMESAPATARHNPRGTKGMFFGYDFHSNGEALGLIEINTNAGGAMLNVVLARAQRACCQSVELLLPGAEGVEEFERALVAMFRSEWQATGADRPLRTVAIVDEVPAQQYLYPEFLLFQRLLERHGLKVLIADPADLVLREGALRLGDTPIDLVYNRLTDFYLETKGCAVLREAWLQDAVVLSPHPQAYALYADKRRLAELTDAAFLASIGVDRDTLELLQREIPRTVLVGADNADHLWAERRRLFFKPVSGYASRAAYRGDKLTRRVWEEIVAGAYVAQALVAPGERRINAAEGLKALKFDLRNYVYDGRVQWTAARLYQGQTTNFRTAGGGFAPVFSTAGHSGEAAVSRASQEDGASAGHASYVFLLDEAGEVHPLPHALYVALARADGASESLAGRSFRLADWYVRLKQGQPERVVNEWYGWVRFDTQGRYDPTPTARLAQGYPQGRTGVDASALPTAQERARMETMLFGSR